MRVRPLCITWTAGLVAALTAHAAANTISGSETIAPPPLIFTTGTIAQPVITTDDARESGTLAATAQFTIDNNALAITVANITPAGASGSEFISGIGFTLDAPAQQASLATVAGNLISLSAGGNAQAASGQPAWSLREVGGETRGDSGDSAGSNTQYLLKAGANSYIIGAPESNGTYAPSYQDAPGWQYTGDSRDGGDGGDGGSGQWSRGDTQYGGDGSTTFVNQSAQFTLDIPGITSSQAISNVQFYYGSDGASTPGTFAPDAMETSNGDTASAVPEPASFFMAVPLLGLLSRRRR